MERARYFLVIIEGESVFLLEVPEGELDFFDLFRWEIDGVICSIQDPAQDFLDMFP